MAKAREETFETRLLRARGLSMELIRRELEELSPAEVERYSRDPHPKIRAVIATRGDLQPEIAAQLAQDKAHAVRHHIARNPRTPSHALPMLAADQSRAIRVFVAKHPNVQIWAARLLLVHEDRLVDRALIRNPEAPHLVFEHFLAEGDPEMLRLMTRNRRVPPRLQHAALPLLNMRGLIGLAHNPTLNDETFMELARRGDNAVKLAMTCNEAIPQAARDLIVERRAST